MLLDKSRIQARDYTVLNHMQIDDHNTDPIPSVIKSK